MYLSKACLLACCLLIFTRISFSQKQLPVATNFEKSYSQGVRDPCGVPGQRYWQNSADYLIRITFHPETRELAGTVGIDYSNNSPDTLDRAVFKLYANIYQAQAIRNMPVAPEDLTKGVDIHSIRLDTQLLDAKRYTIRGTNLFVKNLRILPGQKVHFDIGYSYTVNKGSFIRTGQVDSGAFVIAYSFPRIAVYDDIDGWNEYPYAGREEFYNDYGHFKAELTVPDNYQVWATGDLTNAEQVYNPQFVQRICTALERDAVTDIITEEDLQAGDITQKNKTNTWNFEADKVIDFAFALSNHYVWKAAGITVDAVTGRRTRVDAVFNPAHKSYLPVIDYARKTVDLIDTRYPGIPFPYPHITIFEGLDAMEYPMMVNNLPFDKADAVEFTVHEIFHTIFPFYVGTNETKYSFMDEGWATLSEFTLYRDIDSVNALDYDMEPVNSTAGTDQDVPIMTLTPQLYGKARYSNKDLKPALGFLYVKEMLGEKVFDRSLRFFIETWKGRHPTPYDLFHCFNTASGVNLNWFWRNWFFEKRVPDLAIGKVTRLPSGYSVVIQKIGDEIVPVHLTVLYKDGTSQTLTRSIACWADGASSVTLKIASSKPVKQLIVGTHYDVDVNKGNNSVKVD